METRTVDGTPVLVGDQLCRVYGGAAPVVAVDHVTVDVHAGTMVALTGSSGSGKTSLLGLLGLLDTPDSGRVLLHGHDVSGLPDRDRTMVRATMLGFVFQQFHLISHLSAIANVEVALRYRGLSGTERSRRAAVALDRVGLGHRRDHVPAKLSGGEQQRVAVARALVNEPAVILADEPTGNLDSDNSHRLLDLLRELVAGGSTILVVTHDDHVAGTADRVLVMRDGQLVTDREPAVVSLRS
ncbi:MAG: ABC transporter ATP-binding protein [Tetrasphaera sp.]